MRSAHLLDGPTACRRFVGGLLLAAVVCGTVLPHPIQAQDKVRLTLQERSDRGRELLPEGTEVLVLREEGSRARSLEELGIDRRDLFSRLLARAKNQPSTLLDTLGTNGKTQKLYTTKALLYLLARTPRGTLYENQVWRGVGFDIVVSGNQIMAPVPDGDRQGVFEEVINIATKTRLTLIRNGGRPLPKNTEVRIWARDGKQSQAVPDRSFLKEKTIYKGKLGNGGKTEKHFGRTWHSDSLLYVAARTTNGRIYESVSGSSSAFSPVGTGKMSVAPIGSSGREVVQAAFGSSSEGVSQWMSGWAGGFTLWLIGIITGIAGAWWWYGKKISRVKERKNELKAELRKKAREKHRSDIGVITESMRSKNDELRQEVAELRKKVRERDQELQKMAQDQCSSQEPPPTVPSYDPEGSEIETGSPVTEHFVEWCRRDGAMTGRYYMFERALHEEDINAAVTPIYYDSTTEDRFRLDRDVSSHEFWMVEANADLLLLPAPKSDGTFRALAPAYEIADAAPSVADLQSIAPARLESVEAGYLLHKKGVLNTDPGASPPDS